MIEIEPIERRRRQRRRDHKSLAGVLALVAGFAGLAILVGCGIAAVLVCRSVPSDPASAMASAVAGPTAEREGEIWTHRDLLNHLAGKGLAVEMEQTNSGSVWGPAAHFYLQPGGYEVYVQKRASAQDAKDKIGVQSPVQGFAWGRFIFQSGDPATLTKLKRALGVR